MHSHWLKCTLLFSMLLLSWHTGIARSYTLAEIEHIALTTAPEIQQSEHKQAALKAAAIQDGQLPDPKLHAGVLNLPTDTFSFTQENMTQITVGLSQAFPRGRSLSVKSQQTQLLAQAEQFNRLNTKATILQVVRLAWLDLYYWTRAGKIVEKNRLIFQHLVEVTESMLAAGKTNQHDVLLAQLQLSQIENRKIQIAEQIEIARAQLARWTGNAVAKQVVPQQLPHWPAPPNQRVLQQRLRQHPLLKADANSIAASKTGVTLAKQQYKPGWSLGVNYGFRQGDNSMQNGRRSDFISAQLSLDLPVFPGKRQTQGVNKSLAEFNASQNAEQTDFRKLNSDLLQTWSTWQQLTKQALLYKNRLNPEAKQYAMSALTAYQNNQADFPTVARAYTTELNTLLDSLQIAVARQKIRATLLYLEGSIQ